MDALVVEWPIPERPPLRRDVRAPPPDTARVVTPGLVG